MPIAYRRKKIKQTLLDDNDFGSDPENIAIEQAHQDLIDNAIDSGELIYVGIVDFDEKSNTLEYIFSNTAAYAKFMKAYNDAFTENFYKLQADLRISVNIKLINEIEFYPDD